jgi:hypothetical protein
MAIADNDKKNKAARKSTEAYASPFSTAFGGTAPSTQADAARAELNAVRQYASPFSTAFGGTADASTTQSIRESDERLRARISSSPNYTPPPPPSNNPPPPENKDNAGGIPAMNDRSREPGPAKKGYRWRWVSMSKTNNPYGGEWREEWAGGVQDGPGNDDGNNDGSTGDIYLVSTYVDDNTGDTIGYFSDGSKRVLNKGTGPVQSQQFKDAYSLLEQTFRDYGLETLVPAIKDFMARNLGPEQAALEIRSNPAYIARFKGNDLRRAQGKNALSEVEYLNLENSYDETLRAYGQQGYFGIDRASKQLKMAEIIGNDISAMEFKDRIDTVVTRVTTADPTIKSTLRSFFNIGDEDLIGYFLNPKENLPKLQEKVTSAEIGSAAIGQGLMTSADAAIALAQFGVTKQQAQEGYQAIGAILPTATKLGEIYNQGYTQDVAEQEVFKGTASAQRKRQQLIALEEAQFGGSSGRMRTGKATGNQGAF